MVKGVLVQLTNNPRWYPCHREGWASHGKELRAGEFGINSGGTWTKRNWNSWRLRFAADSDTDVALNWFLWGPAVSSLERRGLVWAPSMVDCGPKLCS